MAGTSINGSFFPLQIELKLKPEKSWRNENAVFQLTKQFCIF